MLNLSLVDALEKSLCQLGLAPIIKSYLSSAFDAADLRSVKPRDLPRALRFISDLQDMASAPGAGRRALPNDLKADGSLIVVHGQLQIGTGETAAPKSDGGH